MDKANQEIEALHDVWVRGYQDGAAAKWQPIETAPKDGTPVLLSDGEAICTAAWECPFNQKEWAGWLGYYTPTHWQPLPELPK